MKVIFDTNIWISYFLCKSFNELSEILLVRDVEIVISEKLLLELKKVLTRRKFKKSLDKEKLNEIENLLISRCTFYFDKEVNHLCRDPKDNFILDLANISRCNYIITGDKDLLVLKSIKRTKIVNWIEYIKLYNEK
jgi:uncharacterized protein